MKTFIQREAEPDPIVINAIPKQGGEFFYALKQIKGDFTRVIPSSWYEIRFIRSLEKGYNLFAPWNGDGVIVMTKYLPR